MKSILFEKFEAFKEECSGLSSRIDLKKVEGAFNMGYQILGDKSWESGTPILLHSLAVARIVAVEIGLETDSIVVALLHNVFESTSESDELIAHIPRIFGPVVDKIMNGLIQINSIDTVNISMHSENFRKLMLTMSDDIRVVLIKIADRLEDMRNLDGLPRELKEKYATESSVLFAPLAHRLGFYAIKTELEDTSLKYLHPKEYYQIVEKLEETTEERKNFVSEFVKPIEIKLKERGFIFDMKARTKSIHSIWNKMSKKKVSFEEVYDLFAIRVILDSPLEKEKSECWQVFSIVTEEYQSNPDRLRDWISIPKSNGYESLHTTVMGPHKKWVEVQIRTQRMDEVAEKGLAAHWKYKGGKEDNNLDSWLKGIREVLENPDGDVMDFISEFQNISTGDEVFVFTPNGDLKKLTKGATILDFAYEIHSDLGDKCVGGKVNNKKVTMKHVLSNGDYVSIETSNAQRPKLDWLDFVVSSKAKNRIKSSLNAEQKLEAENGKEIVKRKFKNWKIDYNDETVRQLMTHFKLKTAQDLYYKVSVGEIEALALKSALIVEEAPKAKDTLSELLPKKVMKDLSFSGSDEYLVIDKDLKNVNYNLAPCCNPIFGDDIFGFVTIGSGIKIHRESCPNAPQMKDRYPYRIIKATWKGTTRQSSFQATIHMSGTDRMGMVGDISYIISKDVGVQMRSINVDSKNGVFDGTLRVFVNDVEHLDFLMHKLQSIKGIDVVTRADT